MQANKSQAVLWVRRSDHARALPFLCRAEGMYKGYLAPDKQPLLSPAQVDATAQDMQALHDRTSDA